MAWGKNPKTEKKKPIVGLKGGPYDFDNQKKKKMGFGGPLLGVGKVKKTKIVEKVNQVTSKPSSGETEFFLAGTAPGFFL